VDGNVITEAESRVGVVGVMVSSSRSSVLVILDL
jgi:hypothetical protein